MPILFKLKIMKQLLLSIFSLACSFVLASCGSSSDDTPAVNETITVSPTDISLDGAGSSVSAQIKTDHEWGAEVSDTWIKISPSSSLEHSATVTISAAENPTTIEREGTITIKSGAARAYIKVKQGAGVAKYEAPDGYSMVWHDEFNTGTQLDKSDWTYEVQPSGWVNNELQNYVAGDIDGNPVTEIVDGQLFQIRKQGLLCPRICKEGYRLEIRICRGTSEIAKGQGDMACILDDACQF